MPTALDTCPCCPTPQPLTAIQPRGRSLHDVLNDLFKPKQDPKHIQEAEQKESAGLSIPGVLEILKSH